MGKSPMMMRPSAVLILVCIGVTAALVTDEERVVRLDDTESLGDDGAPELVGLKVKQGSKEAKAHAHILSQAKARCQATWTEVEKQCGLMKNAVTAGWQPTKSAMLKAGAAIKTAMLEAKVPKPKPKASGSGSGSHSARRLGELLKAQGKGEVYHAAIMQHKTCEVFWAEVTAVCQSLNSAAETGATPQIQTLAAKFEEAAKTNIQQSEARIAAEKKKEAGGSGSGKKMLSDEDIAEGLKGWTPQETGHTLAPEQMLHAALMVNSAW